MTTKAIWMALWACSFFILGPVTAEATDLGAEKEHEAESNAEDDTFFKLALGARVGGYGFRDVDEEGDLTWERCRMNGVGVFTTLDMGAHFFTEASIDVYHTTGEPTKNGIDRLAVHALVSVGARFFPEWWVSPHVQFGGGAEFSSAEIYGAEAHSVAPIGFLGIGGELTFWESFRPGMAIRSHLMPIPEYDWKTAQGDVRWKTEVAGQALFYARFVF